LFDRSILLGVSSNCSDALDGRVFAAIPFDRQTLEHLRERARCYRKAREVYPNLYETYEFHSVWQIFLAYSTRWLELTLPVQAPLTALRECLQGHESLAVVGIPAHARSFQPCRERLAGRLRRAAANLPALG